MTYSGLIAFIVGIISVFTGLVFVLIVTRRLSPEEFGTWALIGSMISYFLISEGIIHFWTIRQVARGEQVGSTSLVSSGIFSLAAIPFYLLISYFISDRSNLELEPMILATILIPLFFISKILNSINAAHRPQATSYGFLIFEISKIPAALALVYFLGFGLTGAIMAVALAYCIRIATQLYFAKPKLNNKINFSYLIRWIKLSWLSLYSLMPKFIASLDVLIYTLIVGSVIGVAYYGVSLVIANLVLHSQKISLGLYPKLLAKGDYSYIKENFSLLLYFAIPLLGIAIVFSKPALFTLNPVYLEASVIVIILSFKVFFMALSEILRQVLLGIEKVDINQNAKFSQLLKSKLFYTSTIWTVKSIIYVSLLVPIFWILNDMGTSEIEITTYWAWILLTVEIPFFVYFLFLVKRNIQLSFPYSNVAKYIGATIAFMIVYFFTSEHIITYHESIFDFLPLLISQLFICVGIYLTITYTVDSKTRKLFKLVIKEISGKIL